MSINYDSVLNDLTPEERNAIRSKLEGKCCTNCTNGCCNVPTREKFGVDEDGLSEGSSCIGWENDRLVGRSKVLGKHKIHELIG